MVRRPAWLLVLVLVLLGGGRAHADPRDLGHHAAKDRVAAADVVVFDIDNLLVDTRGRTVAIARAFAASHRELEPSTRRRMRRATAADVDYGPAETARRFRLGPEETRAFTDLWEQRFFGADMMLHDARVPSTLALADAAYRLGKEVMFVTGRNTTVREATLAQLRVLLGPRVRPGHLHTKVPGENTPAYKAQRITREVSKQRRVIVFDDSPRNLQAMLEAARGMQPPLTAVLVIRDVMESNHRPRGALLYDIRGESIRWPGRRSRAAGARPPRVRSQTSNSVRAPGCTQRCARARAAGRAGRAGRAGSAR